MLAGSYPMSVDTKARVTLPAVFRKQLADGDNKTLYLLPLKNHVRGFTSDGLSAYINGLFEHGDEHFDPRDEDEELLKSMFWARSVSVDIDSAGRIALGKLDVARPGTREQLGLMSEVTVAGCGDHFEVWNTAEWNKRQASFEDQLEALLYRSRRR